MNPLACSLALTLVVALAAGPQALGQPVPRATGSPASLVPSGFVVTGEIRGDLNRDNQEDRVLIVKATRKEDFFKHDQRGLLDRNRRGIIIALGNRGGHDVVLSNLDCFSSENEDGGVYFAPELSVEIRRGSLVVHYAHGRYGYWAYTFRYQGGDFELIGFDRSENRGPVTERSVSMNFMTRKIRIRQQVDTDADGTRGERFRETWQSFALPERILLRAIRDFEAFDIDRMLAPARR
jgi:hypothetical protein